MVNEKNPGVYYQKACRFCGKEFLSWMNKGQFCGQSCYRKFKRQEEASKNANKEKTRASTNKDKETMRMVWVVPTKAVMEIFAECRPVEGRMYLAERHSPTDHKQQNSYIINIGGKRVLMRQGEVREI